MDEKRPRAKTATRKRSVKAGATRETVTRDSSSVGGKGQGSDSIEGELLAAIRADFDDDGPRLVYADWLTERGDPRGEFIQVQCALKQRLHGATGRTSAPDNPPPDYAPLRQREEQLYKKHRKTWLQPIAPFIRKYSFRRGFVDGIESGPRFFEGADAVFARHPVETLLLQGMKKESDYAALADTPLPGLRELLLEQQTISSRSMARAFGSPVMSDLPSLSLYACTIELSGMVALFEESKLANLRFLHIGLMIDSYNDGLLASLGRSSTLRGLETIGLGSLGDYLALSELTPEGVIAFAEQCQLPRLKRVAIDHSRHGNIPPEVLAALQKRFEVSGRTSRLM